MKTPIFALIASIWLLSTSSALSYDKCPSFFDCIEKYRQTKGYSAQVYYLNQTISKWKPIHQKKNLKWARDTLAYTHYNNARPHYLKFQQNKDRASFQKALHGFSKALQVQPLDYIYYYRGMTYFLDRRFNKAAEDFKSGIQTNPHSFYNYGVLADILIRLNKTNLAFNYINQGIEKGEEKLSLSGSDPKKLGKLKKEFVGLYGWLAKLHFMNDKLLESRRSTRKGIELFPSTDDFNLSYYGFLASAMAGHRAFGAGEYSSAIILYEAANNLRKLNSHAAKTTNRGTSWEYWINLVRKREKLGKIRPEKIHRILAFYIDKTDVEFESASGKIL